LQQCSRILTMFMLLIIMWISSMATTVLPLRAVTAKIKKSSKRFAVGSFKCNCNVLIRFGS
jgi:hypothetical protein